MTVSRAEFAFVAFVLLILEMIGIALLAVSLIRNEDVKRHLFACIVLFVALLSFTVVCPLLVFEIV